MKSSSAFLLALFALAVTGCSAVEGLFGGDDVTAASTEEKAATSAPTTSSGSTAGSEEVVPGDWRVLVILDTTTDNTFFAPEAALSRALEDSNIKLMRHTSRDPIEVTDAQNAVVGKVDVTALTDQKSGYIFAEEGRPANFISSASLPFVLQQASAYFGVQIRMNNGQRASGGLRMGPNGAAPGAGKGAGPKAMTPEMRQRLREHKVDASSLKNGKATHIQGGGAAGGATGADGGTTEQ